MNKKVIDIYPLSPTQQGLLFHSLYEPNSGVYVVQVGLTLQGALNVQALKQAWQEIIQRHEVLRTAFVWDNLEEPLQVVGAEVSLPFTQLDWQCYSQEEQQEMRSQWLATDRTEGFDLAKAPLMRLTLIQLDRDRCWMLWTYHHILLDGWSVPVLLKELLLFYQTFQEGNRSETFHGTSLHLQRTRPYRDYIAWLKQQNAEEAQTFWRQRLQGITAPTPLGMGQQGTKATSHEESQRLFDPELTQQLRSFTQRHRLTLNTLLQGAWAYILGRYSQASEVVFGSAYAGRPPELAGVETMVGLFINTLPIRVDVGREQNVIPWLQQLQVNQQEQQSYAHTPLIEIQGCTDVSRSLPLFESVVVFENYPVASSVKQKSGAFEIKDVFTIEQTNYPLTLYAAVLENASQPQFSLKALYAQRGIGKGEKHGFTKGEIDRLLGHLETVLRTITNDSQSPLAPKGGTGDRSDRNGIKLGDLPLLTIAEIEQLSQWNQTEVSLPSICVPQLFEQQVKAHPDGVALTFQDQSFTYETLNRQVNQLADYLIDNGVQVGTRVAVWMARSPFLVISLLAILKAGGIYIPLDPQTPTERLSYILQDAEPSWLLVDRSVVPPHPVQVLNVSEIQSGTTLGEQGDKETREQWEIREMGEINNKGQITNNKQRSPLASSLKLRLTKGGTNNKLAYIIYTSGTTGTPKGVPIRHESLNNLLQSMARSPGMTAHDTLLAITSVAFDIATLELFLPLIVGGRLVVASQEQVRNPKQLSEILLTEKISIMQGTPATWRLLLTHGWRGDRKLKILCGGEALDVSLAQQLLSWGGEVWNLYGPTETTIWSSALRLEPEQIEDGIVPIGGAIANTQFQVLDSNHQPLPIGVSGELHIAGVGLSPGYWHRPELTAEKFIPNPFAKETGRQGDEETRGQITNNKQPITNNKQPITNNKLYKTGDRVRYREDGTLEYLGRLDNQVKLRGFRIELGEIEAAIAAYPGISQAVTVIDSEQGTVTDNKQQLISYFTGENISPQALRNHLKSSLPSYMIPSLMIHLETLPLTANGKIDRAALPKRKSLKDKNLPFPEMTPTEELLAGIWSRILNLKEIHREDHFFEQGGHSLLATRAIAQVREVMGVEIPLSTLFEHPTLSDFAQVVEQGNKETRKITKIVSELLSIPLSFAQQRQWILHQLEPNSPRYGIPTALELNGEFSIERLQESLDLLVQRHEILRTVFKEHEGQVIQEIQEVSSVVAVQNDLSHLNPQQQTETVEETLKQLLHTPFDLSQTPLMRVQVLKLAPEKHILFVALHHIITDAWSMRLMVQELSQIYTALRQGHTPQLPELPIQYADYAFWQRNGDGIQEQQLNYWKAKLKDAPPLLELPTDFPRPRVQGVEGSVHEFHLSQSQAEDLERLSLDNGVTLFMTLFAVFQVLLYRYTHSVDILTGTAIANRQQTELENLIGLFVNTLVLRTNLAGNPSFLDLLQQVRQTALEAYAHQEVPFEQVVDALELPRSWSHSPLFQVMFNLQNKTADSLSVGGLEWTPLALRSHTAKFDLTLSMRQHSEGLTGVFEYRTDLFTPETIERMAGHFCQLVTGVWQNPQHAIALLPLLTASEQQQLTHSNQTHTVHPPCQSLHSLFEAQAERTPDAMAIIHDHQVLTYDELNQQANQLAHALQELGITPEARVGVCLPRTPEMVVAILGILKAGGAYVPLDPAYPQARLRWIVEDAALECILTSNDCTAISDPLPVTRYQLPITNNKQPITNNKQPITNPENLAYVIYTSGSTGQPKGVAIEHRSAIALVHWAKKVFSPEQLQGVLASTSICFDLSVFEIFVPLSWGGSIVLVDNILELPSSSYAEQVTLINTVPSAATELLRMNGIPKSVRIVNLAGEALSPALVAQLYELPQVEQVFNLYGPSEDTTYSTYTQVAAEEIVTIGHCIDNTQAYVLDEFLQPVPIGVSGELYLGGAGLARGYLNRPDLTAEKFIPNPFAKGIGRQRDKGAMGDGGDKGDKETRGQITNNKQQTTNNKLYKTGDRVRMRSNGKLDYLDRLDNQVKIRGFRIELGEIETVLTQHPAVEQALVTVRSLEGYSQLVAYVVLEGNREQSPLTSSLKLQLTKGGTNNNFKEFLKARLPDYMIPAFFVILESMPLLPNGKRDRSCLPIPSPQVVAEENSLPKTEIERVFAEFWQQLLPVNEVGVDQNFFELGGDSILAIQFMAKAQQAGFNFTPRDLFEHQTIAELAAIAQKRQQTQILGAEQGFVTGTVPLTPIQQWFFEQSFSEPYHWNQALLLDSPHSLNLKYLKQALSYLIDYHDALRMTFQQQEKSWEQVHGENVVSLTVFEEKEIAPEEIDSFIISAANQLQASLKLAENPLLKVAYFQFEKTQKLLLVSHHLIIDGISWRIFLSDLQQVYNQIAQGKIIELPPKTTSFKYWSEQLLEYAQSPTFSDELSYWQSIEAKNTNKLPRDYETGENRVSDLATVAVSLSIAETNQLLQEVHQAYQTQINDILLTALATTFQNWTGRSSLYLELEAHGRETFLTPTPNASYDLSRTVGWFTSLFPVVLTVTPDLETSLKTVKETLRKIPQRGVSYGLLRYHRSRTNLSSQAEVMFNYLGQINQFSNQENGFTLAKESTGMARSPKNHRTALLEINAWVNSDRFEVNWLYSQKIHQHHTIETLAQDFLNTLRQLIAHCLSPKAGGFTPSDFPQMQFSQDELDDLLEEL